MSKSKSNQDTTLGVDRRTFLKVSGAVAAAAAAGPVLFRSATAKADPYGQNDPDVTEDDTGVVFIHSTCQMCHSRCGIKAKVKNGVLLKIDGNPWHPNNMEEDGERLAYATTPAAARNVRGRLCPKGQSGIQTLYDPFRIQHPLKRVGARGSGKWEVITWTTAFTEIAAKINALIPFGTRQNLIDAGNADLGKLANGLAYSPGRTIEGDFTDRIFSKGFGTANARLDHTSICETSHHVANQLITDDHVNNPSNASSGRGTNHFKPDLEAASYVIFFGTNPVEANFPMLALARKMMDMRAKGGKVVVVDPRFSNSAAKADQWVPIKPGTDAALALGMARVILAAGTYDDVYLKRANKVALSVGSTYTDATWFVITDAAHADKGKFLTAAQAGIASPLDAANPVCYLDTTTTVTEAGIKGTTPPAVAGELDPGTVTINGIECRTAFGLFKDRVNAKTLDEYALICGVPAATITQLASEFAAAKPRASASTYRGTVQHTNGTYAQMAVMSLNLLVGNIDRKGGMAKGSSYSEKVSSVTGTFDANAVPNAVTAVGPRIDRANAVWFQSGTPKTYYTNGVRPRRPWFPLAYNGNYQEIIPSIQDAYPYPLKVLITYWNAFPYSVPGLREVWEQTVSDETKLPLLVSISPVMGEVPAWADYILPDTTYLEKWAVPGTTPTILTKFQGWQQPVVGKYGSTVIGGTGTWTFDPTAANAYTPYLPDTKQVADIMIGLAKAISGSFPGVGANAFTGGGSLDYAWDYFKILLENLAYNSGATSGNVATRRMEIVDRGGYFDDSGTEYDATYTSLQHHKYGGVLHFYSRILATTVDSMSLTGQTYDPLPRYEPVQDAMGSPVADPTFPFQLITYKSVLHGQARTIVNPWLTAMQPENWVELSTPDARWLGVENGDRVRVVSASNAVGIEGKVRVQEGLRPGVAAISHHFGHWELNSRPYLSGTPLVTSGFDASRGSGITANPIMRLDPTLGNVSLQDRIGGSVAFNDTRVAIIPVTA